MIRAETFIEKLQQQGFGVFSGVPCSYLTPFINTVIDTPSIEYIPASNEAEAMGVLSTVGGVAALIMFVLGIPSLVTGLGMWKFAPWSRYAALILAALNVFNFPIGTGLAIYTGWALLQDESPAVFGEKKSNATA